MRYGVVGLAVLVAAVGTVGLFLGGACDVSAQEGALKIAVVDLKRIAMDCKMGKARATELEASIKEKSMQIEGEKDKFKKLVEELKLLDVDSEEASHKRRMVTEQAMHIKAQDAIAASEFQLKRAAAYREVYSEIFKELEKYRQEKGLHAILRQDDMDMTELPPLSVMGLLRSNTVLVCDPALNVTDEIIKRLDASHSAKPQ